jgi:hypothetical protein
MDTMTTKMDTYRDAIEQVLSAYTAVRYANGDITNEAVFDRQHDRFLVVSVGWQGSRRVQHCLLHIDIMNGKVWIQRDGTEDGIADELEAAGIPKSEIVLAFHPAKDRSLIPEYAVA